MRPGLRIGGVVFAALLASVFVLAALRGVLRAGDGAPSADRVPERSVLPGAGLALAAGRHAEEPRLQRSTMLEHKSPNMW